MRLIKIAILLVFAAVVVVPMTASAQCWINDFGVYHLDTDCDSVMDNTDMEDNDFNGLPDGEWVDNCRYNANGNCDLSPLNCDVDGDTLVTDDEVSAGFQSDWDDDDEGDACDDTDYDGVADYLDNCKTVANTDQDPSMCTDTDGDKFEDPIDNCPEVYNPNQNDTDEDDVGDACDNCRMVYNPGQDDADDDRVGDLCESNDYVTPDVNPDTGEETEGTNRPIYDFGPDRMEGNGFGKGGCSLNPASAADAGLGLVLMASLAIAAIRRRS